MEDYTLKFGHERGCLLFACVTCQWPRGLCQAAALVSSGLPLSLLARQYLDECFGNIIRSRYIHHLLLQTATKEFEEIGTYLFM